MNNINKINQCKDGVIDENVVKIVRSVIRKLEKYKSKCESISLYDYEYEIFVAKLIIGTFNKVIEDFQGKTDDKALKYIQDGIRFAEDYMRFHKPKINDINKTFEYIKSHPEILSDTDDIDEPYNLDE